jgi:hypothetical protein
MSEALLPDAHVAKVIEPGAIMVCSWGYDQTNVDYYMVTRVTAKSCWILPMSSHETETGFMSGRATPVAPVTKSRFCTCQHAGSIHYDDDLGPSGCLFANCECEGFESEPVKAELHKIQSYTFGDEVRQYITMTSYSSAHLWEGASMYASHYA